MSLRIVAQCVDRAALLVDNVSRFVPIKHGVVVYLSFLAGATDETVDTAVKTLLTTKIFNLGVTSATAALSVLSSGDDAASEGSPSTPARKEKPKSIAETDVDVLIIPQATLAGKVKGKLMQYHGQVPKDEGFRLYQRFCCGVRSTLLPAEAPDAFDVNGVPLALAGAQEAEVAAAARRLVVNGTYGNRQGLRLEAYGPYSTTLEF